MTDTGPRPTIPYWLLWTDAQGLSHQQRRELTAFELKRVGPADPQWNDAQPRGEATTVFTVQPVRWTGHRSETIGAQSAVLMTVQLHEARVRAPGHLK